MRNNNFDVLRLLFALLVIFSHSFALVGLAEPTIWGRTLGNLAVHGFFVISGYLITLSYIRSPSFGQFALNRFLRIVPALVIALVASSLVASRLHGFANNPVPFISNGPVWTLTWEVICYGAVAALGLVGALGRATYPAVFAVGWIMFLANVGDTSDFFLAIVPLFLMFGAGALFAVYLKNIRVELLIVALAGLAISANFSFFTAVNGWIASHVPFLYGSVTTPEQISRVIYLLSFPIVVIWIGRLAKPSVSIKDDLSYGAYIYGWPVAQVLVFLALKWSLPLNPFLLFLATITVTLPLAFLSWRFIERPSLRLKNIVPRLLSRYRTRSVAVVTERPVGETDRERSSPTAPGSDSTATSTRPDD